MEDVMPTKSKQPGQSRAGSDISSDERRGLERSRDLDHRTMEDHAMNRGFERSDIYEQAGDYNDARRDAGEYDNERAAPKGKK